MTHHSTFRTALQHQRLQDVYRAHLQSINSEGRVVAGAKTRAGLAMGQSWMEQTAKNWDDLRQQWNDNPNSVWIWSDLHLFHKNISRHAGRPFDNVEYMNSTMLANTQIVGSNDILLFVGDVSFGDTKQTQQWLQQCPGRKFLILGNHDIDRSAKTDALRHLGFDGIAECISLNDNGRLLWLTHYPLHRNDVPKDALNIHGHTHQYTVEGPFKNVCVEHLNYTPVRLMQLLEQQ